MDGKEGVRAEIEWGKEEGRRETNGRIESGLELEEVEETRENGRVKE